MNDCRAKKILDFILFIGLYHKWSRENHAKGNKKALPKLGGLCVLYMLDYKVDGQGSSVT